MPKEITHWILAEKVLSEINNNSVLNKIILQHKNLYLTGAVIMDTPAYVFCSRDSKVMNQLTREMHNLTTNSFKPLDRIIKNYPVEIPDEVLALILGIITHIMVDSVFHPFICYYCNGQTIRHRLLETNIDFYYMNELSLKNKMLFSGILKGIEIDKKQFLDVLSIFFSEKKDINISLIKKALRYHAVGQGLFFRKGLRIILQALDFIPGLNLESFIALFYPPLKYKSLPVFCNPIEYMHPVSGKRFKHSLRDLECHTIQEALNVFQIIESYLKKGALAKKFSNLKGPNLCTGMKNKQVEDMQYFNTDKNLSELIFGSKKN